MNEVAALREKYKLHNRQIRMFTPVRPGGGTSGHDAR